MDPTIPLPPAIAERLEAYTWGAAAPAEPRAAASVILLRDGAERPEIYFLKRHRGMAFAGGMAVFPGGSVDPSDADPGFDWIGPSASEWSSTLRTDDAAARSMVVAAIRELFEETGVLLAGSAASVVGELDPVVWEADRARLEAHDVTFAELLAAGGLALRTDLLKAWAEWITPAFESRRYATRFFVASLPANQSALGVSTEAKSIEWSTAHDAIAAADGRSLLLLPPQYCQCLELYDFRSVAEIFDTPREFTVVEPSAEKDEGGSFRLALPQHLIDLGVDIGRRLHEATAS